MVVPTQFVDEISEDEVHAAVRLLDQLPELTDRMAALMPILATLDTVSPEIHELLGQHYRLTPVPGRGSAPAEEFLVDDGPATVGIIASVSKPFCAACDRLRLTADGQFRTCLFATTEFDLLKLMRAGASDDDLAAEINQLMTPQMPEPRPIGT